MSITRQTIFKGCLIASIAHAIMTNKYPDFLYEQSWDGNNYSIQDSSGIRSTITFESNYCIGAIRDDTSSCIISGEDINKYISNFPLEIVRKAYDETLQYLLLDINNYVTPCITSIFYADDINIYFDKKMNDNIKSDFSLLENIIISEKSAIDRWKDYYDMDSKSIELLRTLYQIKVKDFSSKIVLSEEKIKLIPGDYICDECVESFKELNIFIK